MMSRFDSDGLGPPVIPRRRHQQRAVDHRLRRRRRDIGLGHHRRVRDDVARVVAERRIDDLRPAVGDVCPRIGHVVQHAALRDLRLIDVGEIIHRQNLGIEGDAVNQAVVLLRRGDARDGMAMRIAVDRGAGLRLIERDRLRIRTDARRVVVDLVGGAEAEN